MSKLVIRLMDAILENAVISRLFLLTGSYLTIRILIIFPYRKQIDFYQKYIVKRYQSIS